MLCNHLQNVVATTYIFRLQLSTFIFYNKQQGMLLVKGTDLHVNRLSVEKGEVDLSGTIDSVSYSNISQAKKQEESFWTKMFK